MNLFENINVLYEIIGYAGTILVVLSMMMTSVIKLRIINICGSVLSMTYAIISNTWPIVLMNAALIVINVIQLIRSYSRKLNFSYKKVPANDVSFKLFMEVFEQDIRKHFPNYSINNEEVFLTFIDTEIVGVFVGTQNDDVFNCIIDYAIPKYRDMSVAKYLFPILKQYNVNKIIQQSGVIQHDRYLLKMGFKLQNNIYVKEIK